MDPIRLTIDSLAYGGESVGRLADGRIAFVTGGCPGDVVSASITEDKGKFVRASVSEVVEPSPDRVQAPCPYFGECGGCQWQHVAYPLQLNAKRDAVVEALRRIGGVASADTLVAETIASKQQYNYRNKIELVPDPSSKRVSLGYHKAGTSEVLPVERCLLVPKRLEKVPKALTGALRYAAGDWDLGILRVGIRAAAHTPDVEVALWTPPQSFPRAQAQRTLGQALKLSSLVRVLLKGPAEQRKVTKVEVLAGRGHWREQVSGFDYAISAPSFFQTHTRLAERLVQIVLDYLEPDGSDIVADIYSGAGTFTLPLAERAGHVYAIESYGPAVRDLRRNLEANQLWAEVIGGDAAREVSGLGHIDLAVVDPPRSGLHESVIEALGTARPRTIAYVSCDPATLARDCAKLSKKGYSLTAATPVDLFPQNFHVETVARFERAEQPA